MTTTPRSYRLPRWIGLAAFLAAMPVLAQQPPTPTPTPMPQNPPAPMQTPPAPTPPMGTTPPTTEQPKEKEKDKMAPTIITPAAPLDPNKLADKTVAFEMRDKPWKAVLEWLSNETGLPIITTATPTGTFSFYGNPRKRYTIPEIIDTLNEALLNQKYVLIRRDASITIVPADMQVDPSIVPRITLDELKNRGATEIVSVVMQLTAMNADEVQPEIIKLMGPFREATVLGYSNQLVLQDSAKNLRRVVDTIEQMEKSERKGQNESFSHECKFLKAREAERILKELLGNPELLIRQIAQAQQQQRGQGGDQRQQQPPTNAPKIKMFYISVDDRNNSVLVTGPADKIAQAREIMKKIDVGQPGQQPFRTSAPIIKTYAVTPGSADAVAKTLQEQYKGNTFVRISAVGTNQVMVYAGIDDHFEIARLVTGADPRTNETVLLPVSTMDTEKLALTLKGMFQDPKTGAGPYIEADVARGNIIVKGNSDQVADVRAAMKAIGEGGEGLTGNMRVIPIPSGGNAATLAAELERLMREMRRNPVRVINPTAPKPAEPKKDESRPIPPGGNGGGQDQPQLRDPAKPKPGTDSPVTITVVGGKIIVTSEDPQALALAQELIRLYTAPQQGDGNFEIIKLKHAQASDAARIINDAMNGPTQPQQPQQGGGMGFPFGGGGGGRGFMFGGMNQPAAQAASAATAKVRVIADPASNSLLVKANPLDMLEVKRLLRDSIDAGDESRTLAKTYVLGPFKSAKADDIADVVRDVYRDSMNSNNTSMGRGGGGGFPFGGGQPQQRLTDSLGNPKPAQLTLGIQESTNTIIVHCSEALYKDLDKLTKQLDLAAQGSPRSIRVVSVKGIDPELLQQAINALQGNTATNQNNRGGGGFGFPGMGGGGFGGGNRGMGGGGNRGGGGGGNRGGRGGGGGMRFGGNRAPDREPGGPENFEAGVMEDRQPATKDVANRPQLFDPTNATQLAYAGEEQQQPAPQAPDFRAPIGQVTAEALQELGVIVLRGENQGDIEEILKVIKYIQELGAGSEVQLQLVPMKHADATQLTNTLNQVFSRVIIGPNGNLAVGMDQQRQTGPQRSTNPFFGTTVTATDPATSILLLPLPRFNAILMGAPKARVADILKEIDRLDQPTAPAARANAFPLKKASASRVAGQIQAFYATRYPNETEAQNQIRITHDDSINTVFVQAAPADLAEIKALIERIDGSVSSAVNELRILPLRNALSDELAGILLQSITQGVVAPSATAAPGIVPRPGAGPLFGQQPGAAGRQGPVAQPAAGGSGVTTKTTTLRFYGTDNRAVESGLLEDVHITSEPRSNSLIISAPPKTMDLLISLVRQLDVLSTAQSSIKIFTLKKADAQQTALLLQNFFQGGGAARTTTGQGQLPGLGAATGAGTRPLLTLGSNAGEGATLVDIKITVDDRTNSVVVAGSMNDLQVIEAIISRLEDSDVQARRNDVYRLRNAAAADVANSLQQFLTNTLTVLRNAAQVTAFQEIQRNVVIVPEPISNSLLISATPQYYDDLMRMIVQLDMLPAQVVIQVLIADVKLNTQEEFGVEVGLQSPVLFQRSIIPGTSSFAGQTSGLPLPQGVTVNSTLPGAANPGFNFNQPNIFPQNNFTAGPSIVGFQGLGSLGVGRTSSSGLGGLVFSAASDTFTLLIRALKTQGRVDLLSRPQIMTLDNQTAAVNIGQNVPVLAGTVVSGTGVSQQNIERLDVGINLYVTPRITPDGRVLMRVAPEVSNVDQSTRLDPNGPTINQQKAETTVAANDGETIVIGGLITTLDNKIENKIPWLGDLPVVGSAFRYRTQNREKRELLIILTPHIVRTPEEAQRILVEEARRMDWIMSDVCKVHGPGGLDAIMPGRGGQGCAPPAVSPLPVLNMPIETTPAPEQLPNIVPPPPMAQPQQPGFVPGQPIRPNAQVPQPQPGSPVLPATYQQGIPPAPDKSNPNAQNKNANGKESRPWVFRRD